MKLAQRLLTGIIFIFIFTASAHSTTWQIFNVTNGLPSNKVTSFSFYSKWLAVGTDSGFAIYNGDDCEWKMPELPNQIASLPVKDLAFDEDGALWIATSNGLFYTQKGHTEIYSTNDGLPNIDIDRIQILRGTIIIGCFGGHIAKAILPSGGKTKFFPVNYIAGFEKENLKLSSVGISSLALDNSLNGSFGTLGNGLGKASGQSTSYLRHSDGIAGDWITDLWQFKDLKKHTKMITTSPEGLSFIKNGILDDSFSPISDKPWLTSIITVNNPQYVYNAFKKASSMNREATYLQKFLDKRSLYLGTKASGIWRFQKGIWTNFNTTNSSLPSEKINRLYIMQRIIVAATDGGLVLIPLDSHQNDEFQLETIGTPYCKSILAPPPISSSSFQYFQTLRNKDYWFIHEKGLSRFKIHKQLQKPDGPTVDIPPKFYSSSSRFEQYFSVNTKEAANSSLTFVPSAKQIQKNNRWQLFSEETYPKTNIPVFPIYSQKITKAVSDSHNQCLWLILNQKYLCRMTIRKKLSKKHKKVIEVPKWEFILENSPWPGGTQLTSLWLKQDKLYVGTKGQGFYILENPNFQDPKKTPPEWQHFSDKNGLPINTVIGFSTWKYNQVNYIVILHQRSVSAWDGEFFDSIEMGGLKNYTSIAGDNSGNLWVGSEAGLFRITPEGTHKEYNSFNSGFESNNITAIAIPPANSNRPCGIWVACDKVAKKEKDGKIWHGTDKPPLIIIPKSKQANEEENDTPDEPGNSNEPTEDNNKKKPKIVEQEIEGGSLHFFNGTIWEKWKYGGINSIMLENEFLWLSSNIRIRRLQLSR